MTRSDLLNRVITAAALVALAVTLGVWLTRSPLTAAPAATTPPTVAPLPPPVKCIRPAEALREPTLAPLPPPACRPQYDHDRGASRSGDRPAADPGRPGRDRPACREAGRRKGRAAIQLSAPPLGPVSPPLLTA